MNEVAWIIIFCTMITLCAKSGAQAGKIHPDLNAELNILNHEDEVSVIVTLADHQNIKTYKGNDRKMMRSWIKRSLKDKAAKSQGPLIRFLKQKKARKIMPFWVINGIAATIRVEDVDELASQPGVDSVVLDGVVNQPQSLAAEPAVREWNLDAINVAGLWSEGYRGAGVVIASMDTGVDVAHPDLMSSWRGGSNSWYDPNEEHAAPHDSNGHGTQTMGVMVGGALGGSAIGIAPEASWIAVKLFNDQGTASYSTIHQAFQWLLDPDGDPNTDDLPDVVNSSWGFRDLVGQCFTEFQSDVQTLKAAGVAVVFSSGNAGPNDFTSISPANYPESFAVGGVDDTFAIANSSSRGSSSCDGSIFPQIVSPGVNIKTTDLTLGGVVPDSYTYVSGTSIAAPHVSAAMALLVSANPQITVEDLEASISQSAADLGSLGWDDNYGNGLVDVVAANDLIKSGIGICADIDGDGYPGETGCGVIPDCNDFNPTVYPDFAEIKHDGIDQDCNGYDLTIDIIRSDYRVGRDGIVVWATSDLKADALLQIDIPGIGIQPMTWSVNRQLWKKVVKRASLKGFDPDTAEDKIIVYGHEGALGATVNIR